MSCSRLVLFFCISLLCCCSAFPLQARAQDLELKDMALDNVSGKIQLSYGIEALDVQAIEERLLEGLVLRMECRAKLLRNRRWWMDSLLQEKALEFELKSRPLQESFVLSKKGQDKTLEGQDLGQLLHKAWSGFRVRLGSWEDLQPGEEYAVELRLNLKRSNVPWWLRKSLFFWSWDLMPEKKYRMDFKY
ncbi:MAG: DUF4390 domain-containing protein [Thermodesulfobacteriota bacterium]